MCDAAGSAYYESSNLRNSEQLFKQAFQLVRNDSQSQATGAVHAP